MREVVVQIPTLETEQNIEIDVQINGKKRRMKYRVEIVEWDTEEGKEVDKVSRRGLTFRDVSPAKLTRHATCERGLPAAHEPADRYHEWSPGAAVERHVVTC